MNKENTYAKKRLIFSFYAFDGYNDNMAIKLHLQCLKHYANVFDEALFVILVDDINNKDLVNEIKKKLIDCGFNDISFKVRKNTGYCEAKTFLDEIVCNMKYLDGLTFFGHTKGSTNVQNKDAVIESIEAWILGMYFLNLEYIDEVESTLTDMGERFFGAFLSCFPYSKNKYRQYNGTFYWLNCLAIYDDYKSGWIEIPKSIDNRGFAERFPFTLYKDSTVRYGSHGCFFIIDPDNFYRNSHNLIKFLLDDVDRYEQFKNNILKNIQNNNE